MAEWFGLLRSFLVYWRPGRQRGLRELYAPLIDEGDLLCEIAFVFDAVGDEFVLIRMPGCVRLSASSVCAGRRASGADSSQGCVSTLAAVMRWSGLTTMSLRIRSLAWLDTWSQSLFGKKKLPFSRNMVPR